MSAAKRKRESPHKALLRKHRQFYEQMLADQDGGCYLCGRPPSPRRKLDMDHDHKLMYVRGLLCHRCNRALVSWMTAEWLRKAAEYLEKGPIPYKPEED